jgi:hypothetical protein
MASAQIHRGDYICVTHSAGSPALTFFRDLDAVENWPIPRRAAA